MRFATVGKVVVTARIENLADLFAVQNGTMKADQVRTIDVTDALVDTGATILGAPVRLITQLGLAPARTRQVRTTNGTTTVQIYYPARLTIQGRDCTCDVMALADDLPTLIGQVPLELLDFVVDPIGQRLIGNPEHGGQHMLDLL